MTDWNLHDLTEDEVYRREGQNRLIRALAHPPGCQCDCYERGRRDGLECEWLRRVRREQRFRYWRDVLFGFLLTLYVVHEWIVWAR